MTSVEDSHKAQSRISGVVKEPVDHVICIYLDKFNLENYTHLTRAITHDLVEIYHRTQESQVWKRQQNTPLVQHHPLQQLSEYCPCSLQVEF